MTFESKLETLSDKIQYEMNKYVGGNTETWSAIQRVSVDVKEFIKKLKELLINGNYYGDRSFTDLFENIDKLAGDKFKRKMKQLNNKEIREIISTPLHPFKDWVILNKILDILKKENIILIKNEN